MRYFIDTEFIEAGRHHPIQLISLALVAEDGRELYVISSEFDPDRARLWVREHVIDSLEPEHIIPRKTIPQIADEVIRFIGFDSPVSFWGYYADYAWVVFCQLFGTMMDLPRGFPMYCRDLKQVLDTLGNPRMTPPDERHNALSDARWNANAWALLLLTQARAHELLNA